MGGIPVALDTDNDLNDSKGLLKKLKEQAYVEPTEEQKKEYGLSKWDWEKKRSIKRGNYHWNTEIKDKPEDVMNFHGNINMDCKYFIDTYGQRAIDNTVSMVSRNKSIGGNVGADREQYDIKRGGGNIHAPVFGRANMNQDPKAVKLATELFGIYDLELKMHTQRCGEKLLLHIDNYNGRADRIKEFHQTDWDKDPLKLRRFIVMLNDWRMGQLWYHANAVWTHWKAGDCFSWEWQDTPHATANLGWDTRYILQYTGLTTQKTTDFVANNKSKDIVHEFDIHG